MGRASSAESRSGLVVSVIGARGGVGASTVATNLATSADPAFLRRIGYRIHMDRPDDARYAEIFRSYAKSASLECHEPLVAYLLNRYHAEGRELRACEPRDLIERCRDICNLTKQPPRIDRELLDAAWKGYFG